uniref:RING-type domain-containing protein n=1 Tax=Rhizochromulina marina TaxID=1034831 RepID=A0A7S2SWX2_9STRA
MVESTPLDPRTFNLLMLFSCTAFIIWAYRLLLDTKRVIELRASMLANRLVHVHGLGSRAFLFENVTSYHYQSLANTRPPASAKEMPQVFVPFAVDLRSLKIRLRPQSEDVHVSFKFTAAVPHTVQLVWGLSKHVFYSDKASGTNNRGAEEEQEEQEAGTEQGIWEHEEEQLVRRRRHHGRGTSQAISAGAGGSGSSCNTMDGPRGGPLAMAEEGQMLRHQGEPSPSRRSGSESDGEGKNGSDGAPLLTHVASSSVDAALSRQPHTLKSHCVALSRPQAFQTLPSHGAESPALMFDEVCPFPATLVKELQKRIKQADRRARAASRRAAGRGPTSASDPRSGVAAFTLLFTPDWDGELQRSNGHHRSASTSSYGSSLFTPSLTRFGLSGRTIGPTETPVYSRGVDGRLALHAILVSPKFPTQEEIAAWTEAGGNPDGLEVEWQLDQVLNTVGGETLQSKDIYGFPEEEGEASEECVVCLTEAKDTILLPCRHLCVCRHCFRQIDKCPVCRTPFETYMVFTDKPLGANEVPEPNGSNTERNTRLRTVTQERGFLHSVSRAFGIRLGSLQPTV